MLARLPKGGALPIFDIPLEERWIFPRGGLVVLRELLAVALEATPWVSHTYAHFEVANIQTDRLGRALPIFDLPPKALSLPRETALVSICNTQRTRDFCVILESRVISNERAISSSTRGLFNNTG